MSCAQVNHGNAPGGLCLKFPLFLTALIDLIETGMPLYISVNLFSIRFYENHFNGSPLITCEQTERVKLIRA
jgi:hypothetical protein